MASLLLGKENYARASTISPVGNNGGRSSFSERLRSDRIHEGEACGARHRKFVCLDCSFGATERRRRGVEFRKPSKRRKEVSVCLPKCSGGHTSNAILDCNQRASAQLHKALHTHTHTERFFAIRPQKIGFLTNH